MHVDDIIFFDDIILVRLLLIGFCRHVLCAFNFHFICECTFICLNTETVVSVYIIQLVTLDTQNDRYEAMLLFQCSDNRIRVLLFSMTQDSFPLAS